MKTLMKSPNKWLIVKKCIFIKILLTLCDMCLSVSIVTCVMFVDLQDKIS